MKTLPDSCWLLTPVLLALSCVFVAQAQLPLPRVPLRLEWRTNAFDLVVGDVTNAGALFLRRAPDLQSLVASPSLMLQTNTPFTNELRLPVSPTDGVSNGTFFSAIHWPGRTVEEFAEPEDYPDIPPPAMILLTSGAPTNLASGQTFTVDFFVTDPAGQLLDVSGPVAILIFRESDGALHPDAAVSPSTSQLTNGHLRLAVTVQSITSLDGYALGLGPDTSGLEPFLKGLFFPAAADGLNEFLRTAFNLGPSTLDSPTREALLQTLELHRLLNADAGPSWSYPMAGSGHPLSGTFGEWRGKHNNHVHRGVDLAAVAASTVVASRGGVVSFRGKLEGMGDYLAIDHGGGWFSQYLHLDSAYISVRVGQAVARGSTIATRLYAVGNWPQHLHFEIRHGAAQSQWNVAFPVSGRDPLQESGVFPVPAGSQLPKLEEFGLTRQHPGENAFVKSNPTADANGPVYLVAKFVDVEGGNRLGLRAMRFQPEGLAVPVEIRPQDDTAISALLTVASGAGTEKGFARYSDEHANETIPQSQRRLNYYRNWWRWDTSSYANDRNGPRSLVLTGEDHAPSTADFSFTFGPQIKSNSLTQVTSQQYRFTNVAYLGATTPTALGNDALFVQPDRYKLYILKTNGQPLEGVSWMEGGTALDGHAPLSREFKAHTNEQTYTFTLPQNTDADGLKLRVSSVLVTNIAHEICLCGGPDMAFIPAGSFAMGDELNDYPGPVEHPVHTVQVSAFCMDKHEVTKRLWDEVYNWAITHDYSFEHGAEGKAAGHPAQSMTWYDAVKWCNARSEKEGRLPAYYTSAAQTTIYRSGQLIIGNSWVKWNAGYRLPTEAEWEKAARGRASGRRFPWSDADTISHIRANYYGYPATSGGHAYDLGPFGYHPAYNDETPPYTSPVGSFTANDYGLYDMAGNVLEWCWDRYSSTYYSSSPGTDPRGATSGSRRVVRGGSWLIEAIYCRAANRFLNDPTVRYDSFGFRSVLPSGQ